MRKLLLYMIALGMFSAAPAIADHIKSNADTESIQQCTIQVESIQQRIKRIQGEINEGSTKYNAEDIKKLELKLNEANNILEELNKPH